MSRDGKSSCLMMIIESFQETIDIISILII